MLQEITQLTRQELTTNRPDDAIRECGRAALALLTSDAELAARLAYQKLHDVPYKDVQTFWRRLYTDACLWKVLKLVEGRHDDAAPHETETTGREGEHWLDEAVKALDMALILTGAPARQGLIDLWFAALQRHLSSLTPTHASLESDADIPSLPPPWKRRKLSPSSLPTLPLSFSTCLPPTSAPTLKYPIPRAQNPSLEAFQKKLDDPDTHTPLIMEGGIDHWPALHEQPWNSPVYLMQQTLGGRRLVPVEVGRSYTDDAWGQKIVTFKEFMKTYMTGTPDAEHAHEERRNATTDTAQDKQTKQTGYLAQHDLFAQIPNLRADISVPEYCYCTPAPSTPPSSNNSSSPSKSTNKSTTPLLDSPLLNAWFGPAHTISPLHTDPYHNILTQVVGYKYIRSYAPSETAHLYPRGVEDGGVDMANTSSVDLDEAMEVWGEVSCWGGLGGASRRGYGDRAGGPDAEGAEGRKREFEQNYNGFTEAMYIEGILGPGECLYLPLGWWHYVRSLTPSFSVSFWFN